jgi:hypothetical protein
MPKSARRPFDRLGSVNAVVRNDNDVTVDELA